MSDDELDKEWKPNRRPQSTMARDFSLALNDLFKIDNCVADLDAVVSEKKKAVSTQTSELEALEARLKATEERLKAAGGKPAAAAAVGGGPQPATDSSLAADHKNISRPQTKEGRKQEGKSVPLPGALPPTPGASEGESDSEYVLVEGRRVYSADFGEDGDTPPPQN